MKTYKSSLDSLIVLAVIGLTLGCDSKDKEIQRLKAEIEANKQKEVAAATAQQEKEIANAKTQLELARAKGSLDESFLALKALQTLGGAGGEADKEIERTKRAIETLNSLRVAKGEHRHEDVVQLASEILDLFPENAEARKDMKESGLIFRYLEQALNHQQKCFAPDEKGALSLVTLKTEDSKKGKLDFGTVAFNLQKARELVEEAVKLDPQYEEALSVKKSVRQMQNTIGYLVSGGIFTEVNVVRPLLENTFSRLHSGMADAVTERHDSPQDFWRRTREPREKLEADFSELTTNLDTRAEFLTQLDATEIQNVTGTATRAVVFVKRLQSAIFSPRGNLNDYKADFLAVDAEFSKLVDNYNTSKPNAETVISDLAGFAKTLVGYQLYKKPNETRKILQKHEKLIAFA